MLLRVDCVNICHKTKIKNGDVNILHTFLLKLYALEGMLLYQFVVSLPYKMITKLQKRISWVANSARRIIC